MELNLFKLYAYALLTKATPNVHGHTLNDISCFLSIYNIWSKQNEFSLAYIGLFKIPQFLAS